MRQIGEFHGGVLGDLLGMVGGGSALQDQAGRQHDDTEIADAIAKPAQQHAFQTFLFGEDARCEYIGAHENHLP
ncbi:MAG: hypothetical protein HY289_00145 [Planctomycetes bacterium]|nr:hypothetical protein [Planctomycetota bacterium]